MSIAIMGDAPHSAAPCMTERPTAPRPNTATEQLGSIFAVLTAAPYPVVIAHPKRQTRSRGADGLILAIEISATTLH